MSLAAPWVCCPELKVFNAFCCGIAATYSCLGGHDMGRISIREAFGAPWQLKLKCFAHHV